MEFADIISALRRKKVGALLIGLQIALTLAIVCNSLSIIQQRLQRMHRPTGMDEDNIFTFTNQWIGDPQDLSARIQGDLAVLRSLPGVVDVIATESYPLCGRGAGAGIVVNPEEKQPIVRTAASYLVDQHGLVAFGARLVAGRGFTSEEIRNFRPTDTYVAPPVMIVTGALANSLVPSGNALGKYVYFPLIKTPIRIVGIVDRLQTPWASSGWGEQEYSALLPFQLLHNTLSYLIRTQSGQRDVVMRVAPSKLLELSRERIIDNVLPFSDTRTSAYRSDRALNLILTAVSVLMLTVTAFGVVGLTTYWVAQRRREIGVRRALGARRIDILRYFHTENLVIAGLGGTLGIAVGLAGNLWLAMSMQMMRMGIGFISLGAAIVFVLSQVAVIWPASRAAAIPPAVAARGG